MKEALVGLFSSKKALAGMAGTTATALILLAQKAGYGLDPEATKLLVSAVLGLAGLYILGQGAADWGKERSKVELAAIQVLSTAKKLPDDEDDDEGADDELMQVLTEDA